MNTETPLAFLRDQELSEAEVKAILERYRRRRSSQLLVPTLALLAALAVAVAVPASRAELGDAIRAALQGGELPGRALHQEATPEWLLRTELAPGGEPRVLAAAGDQELLAFRQASGALCFDFGGVGVCDMSDADLFADAPVALFGPTKSGNSGRFQLWGLTLASVVSVELSFADAPSVRVRSNGAFGIALDPDARPSTLTAFDAAGQIVVELSVTDRWSRRPAL